jgi:hypothetical protein
MMHLTQKESLFNVRKEGIDISKNLWLVIKKERMSKPTG